MKIIITGAAGALGSHAAEAFKKAGHDVVGIDCFTDYYSRQIKEFTARELEEAGIEIVRKDLAMDRFDSVLKGADIIFHFAAQPGISATTSYYEYARNNADATYELLTEASQIRSLKLFVHISTSSVYGLKADSDESAELKPNSFYGVTKLAAEQLAMSYHRNGKLPVTVLRLFSVYGERERPEKLYRKVIKSVFAGEPFPLHAGSEHHRRSYTHVSDIVKACLLVTEKIDAAKGEIFNIGNDQTITTGEGLALIEKITGKKIDIKRVSPRPGDQEVTVAKIDKARRILGYEPTVSPEEGLRLQVNWYKKIVEKGSI